MNKNELFDELDMTRKCKKDFLVMLFNEEEDLTSLYIEYDKKIADEAVNNDLRQLGIVSPDLQDKFACRNCLDLVEKILRKENNIEHMKRQLSLYDDKIARLELEIEIKE